MAAKVPVSKPKAYLVPVMIMIVMGLVLFLPAGSLKYWQGWLWWAIISAVTLFITTFFVQRDPGFLARRMQVREKEPQPLLIIVLSMLSMFSYLVPGFDYRFHWSSVPVGAVLAANVVVLAGYLFIFYVFQANSYASTVIQVEEGQQVISTGPYALVRHPMYLGLLLMFLATPLALGSYWALIPAVLFVPTIIFRIHKEEKILRRDLPGYSSYSRNTRYRLVPLLW